jgi:oligoendopeptidase F
VTAQYSDIQSATLASFQKLRDLELNSENCDDWLDQWSNLEKKVKTVETRLNRAIYADTTDQQATNDYETFINEFIPKVEIYRNELRGKLLHALRSNNIVISPYLSQLFEASENTDTVNNRNVVAQHTIMASEFGRKLAALNIPLDGKTVSIGEARARLDDQHSQVREKAWKTIWKTRCDQADEFDTLYLELVKLRQTLARNAGFSTYRDYIWLEKQRFDFTPDDCLKFADAIAEHTLPLLTKVREKRRKLLGTPTLQPWDADHDPFAAPLKPFGTAEELVDKAKKILSHLDPSATSLLDEMRIKGNLDLADHDHKVFTLYADHYFESNDPMLFMRVSGTTQNVHDFFHEFAHAWHFKLASSQPYYWQQVPTLESMELFSQAMELMTLPHLGAFYSEADLKRVRFLFVERLLASLAFVPVLDLFQHWVYTQPFEALSVPALDEKYVELSKKFVVGVDFTGVENERRKLWHFNHIFWQAFYYIEYGFAWIGALDVYANYRDNPKQTLTHYKNAMRFGNSTGLRKVFNQAGSHFPFSTQDVKHVMSFVEEEFADDIGH